MTIEERKERNAGMKRGGNLIGVFVDDEGKMIIEIGPEEECRVMQDIKDVMVERNMCGEITVLRECGTVNREVVQKAVFK